MAVRLFLSCVSDEFGVYRDALRNALTRPNVEVKVQEDFKALGGDTLTMMEDYIKECEAVVHFVGEMTGSAPSDAAERALVARHTDIETRLPPLGPALVERAAVSYTQWEAWLAIYFHKALLIVQPSSGVDRGARFAPTDASRASQAEHLKRLRAMDRYPGAAFTSADNLIAQIYSSVVLEALSKAEGMPTRRISSKRWYVSYAWADESDQQHEEKIDSLCEDAKKRGVEIIRDKTTLAHGDLISEFMRQIGEGDRVFVFLGDKYLHSPYCMFELFEMWRNNRQNRTDFLRQVRFFTVDEARIAKPHEWLKYAAFWKRERDTLGQAIDELGWRNAGQEAIKRYKLMETFAGNISDVLALFADVVNPRTFEDFLKYGFSDPH